MSEDSLLNLSEAAALLGVHPTTLRTWADRGEIASSRTAGRHRRFRRADIEAWSAARRRGGLPGASIVVDAALGRARFDLADGRLVEEPWHQRLDADSRQAHRRLGRRLLSALLAFLVAEAHSAELLGEARLIGQEYERTGREAGLTLAETVQAYLFFRVYLQQSVYDALSTGAGSPEGLKAWRVLVGQVEQFSNEVLVAIIGAHEQAG